LVLSISKNDKLLKRNWAQGQGRGNSPNPEGRWVLFNTGEKGMEGWGFTAVETWSEPLFSSKYEEIQRRKNCRAQ